MQSQTARWAVCPRIDQEGTSLVPRHFETLSEAKRFLSTEWHRSSVRQEAELSGLPTTEVLKRRKELKSRRAEMIMSVRNGLISPTQVPLTLLPIKNRDRGWLAPVPIKRVSDYPGHANTNCPLEHFLPLRDVGTPPRISMEELLHEAFNNSLPDFRCSLGADWLFDQIDETAGSRPGHKYSGRRHDSIGQLIVKGILDIERVRDQLHPGLTALAIADFWESWQVQNHIAAFCWSVGQSSTAAILTGNDKFRAAEEAQNARDFIVRQLASFAHLIRRGGTLGEASVCENDNRRTVTTNVQQVVSILVSSKGENRSATSDDGGGNSEDKQGLYTHADTGVATRKILKVPRTMGSDAAVEALLALKTTKGWTMEELAREVGTTARTLHGFRMRRAVRSSVFRTMAVRLGISPEDLLAGKIPGIR